MIKDIYSTLARGLFPELANYTDEEIKEHRSAHRDEAKEQFYRTLHGMGKITAERAQSNIARKASEDVLETTPPTRSTTFKHTIQESPFQRGIQAMYWHPEGAETADGVLTTNTAAEPTCEAAVDPKGAECVCGVCMPVDEWDTIAGQELRRVLFRLTDTQRAFRRMVQANIKLRKQRKKLRKRIKRLFG